MPFTGTETAMKRAWSSGLWPPGVAGLAGLIVAVLVFGCGKPDPRVGVIGSVTLGDSPLDRGIIEFHGSEAPGPAGGAAIVKGRYEVPRSHGLSPGDYRVVVRSAGEQISGARISSPDAATTADGPTMPDPLGPPRFRERIPPEFGSESRVRRTLVAGRVNTVDVAIPTTGRPQ